MEIFGGEWHRLVHGNTSRGDRPFAGWRQGGESCGADSGGFSGAGRVCHYDRGVFGAGFWRGEIEEAIRVAYRAMSGTQDSELRTQNSGPSVAVRSSATAEDMAGASMAGQYETYLDVVGEEAVIAAVGKCWASISTPRTQAYLREHGIDAAGVAMAVVVQVLVRSQVAGVMFTVNPRTAEEGEILIEASYGLGEAVVSGLVQPDTIVLERATGRIKSCLVGTKEVAIEAGDHGQRAVSAERRGVRCLSEEQLEQLRVLALRAQEHFGRPQDLEWAFAEEQEAGGRKQEARSKEEEAGGGDSGGIDNGTLKIEKGDSLYLLQSRAITTLDAARAGRAAMEEARRSLRAWKEEGRGTGRGTIWGKRCRNRLR